MRKNGCSRRARQTSSNSSSLGRDRKLPIFAIVPNASVRLVQARPSAWSMLNRSARISIRSSASSTSIAGAPLSPVQSTPPVAPGQAGCIPRPPLLTARQPIEGASSAALFSRGATLPFQEDLHRVESSGGIHASLGGRYATALFELARDAKAIDRVEASLATVRQALTDSPEFKALTTSPLLGRTDAGKGDVAVELNVDKDLLGGLVVRIGSQMIDSSIRTRLNILAHAMKG